MHGCRHTLSHKHTHRYLVRPQTERHTRTVSHAGTLRHTDKDAETNKHTHRGKDITET